MKILILDNYDSFTFNLYHYCKSFCSDVQVYRNDAITLDEIENFSHIVISPGPGLPKDAGITLACLARFSNTKKILGVCLGMQAIVEFFGGTLYNQKMVKHGLQEEVNLLETKKGLFKHFELKTNVGLYHSWAADYAKLPSNLKITALSKSGVVMAVQHQSLNICGVQFHPESVLTPLGKNMIKNWIES